MQISAIVIPYVPVKSHGLALLSNFFFVVRFRGSVTSWIQKDDKVGSIKE
jgi:hypothetical protein